MNATQRRLHSYRRRGAVPDLRSTPALARGAIPRASGSGVAFETTLGDSPASVELPARPEALVLALGEAPVGLGENIGSVTLPAAAGADALVAAAAALRALPETRGLPLALAGAGESAPDALVAAVELGPRLGALLLDRTLAESGPVCLTPTYCGPLDAGGVAQFLAEELAISVPAALDRRRRRLLGRRLERRLRRDCRRRANGPLSGRVRAGLGALAATLAFTLSFGLGAGTAQGSWTVNYDTAAGGQLQFTSTAASDQLTLTCDTGGSNNLVSYDTGSGSQTIPFGLFGLQCVSVATITVAGNGGNDTLDLSGVLGTEYTSVGNGDVTVDGGAGAESILGPQGINGNVLDGGVSNDTIIGGSGTDLIDGGPNNDSMVGGGVNDTVDFDAAPGAVDVDLGPGTATGYGTDTLSQVESAIGSDFGDTLEGGNSAAEMAGGAGSDSLEGGALGASTLDGGTGDDTLRGAPLPNDSLAGGAGDDDINGSGGSDTMSGGADDDTLQGGDSSNDLIEGESGNDVASYNQAGSALVIDLSGSTFQGDTVSGAGTDTLTEIEGAIGTDFDDTITGDDQANTLEGEQGADSIVGNDGADFLDGQDDSDTLDGEQGANTLEGGGEADLLASSPTSADAEVLLGEGGSDTLDAGAFGTTLEGGLDADSLLGSGGGDEMSGGDGSDTLDGLGGGDTIAGDADGDTIAGSTGADSLSGGAAGDSIDGDAALGNDESEDTIAGDAGTDTLVQFDGTSGIDYSVSNTKLTNGNTADALSSIERVSLSTGVGDNELDAGGFTAGPVTLDSSSGEDTLISGAGPDQLTGGTDADEVGFSGNVSQTLTDGNLVSGAVTDTLTSIEDASLEGGASANTINAFAFTGTVTIDGAGGNDTIAGGSDFASQDSLLGGSGTDRIFYAENLSQVLDDTLHAVGSGFSAKQDTLSGIEQASLSGGASANDLDASDFSGAVTLDALAGNDTIRGAGGSDLLFGGADSDRVIQSVNASQTLTNSQLTGIGTDVLSGVERVSITGGSAANRIDASDFTAGQVTLDGAGDDDTLLGGAASDSLIGGAANDRIEQTADANQALTDSQVTGDGTDTVNTIEEASLTGGAAANDLDASAFTGGSVTLSGAGGSDTLAGTDEGDSLHAGTGSDRMVATADADLDLSDTLLAISGAADDTISGFDEASLIGGNSDNEIDSSAFSGPSTLQGSGGDDTLEAGDTSDLAIGGGQAGDLFVRNADADMSFTGGNQLITSGLGTDTLTTIDNVSLVGGPGDNAIDGSSSSSFETKVLDGGGGSDTLTGGGDLETLLGGAGPDSLPTSGGFADLVEGGGDADSIGSDTQDTIDGGGGDDQLTTTGGPPTVLGGPGTDRIIHVGGSQTLSDSALTDSDSGGDTIPIDSIEEASLSGSSSGNDLLDADDFTGGPVTLFGDGFSDTLIGTAAGDSLDGGTSFGDQLRQQANSDIDLDDDRVTGDGTDTLAGIELASLTGTAAAEQLDASDFTGEGVSGGRVTISALGGDDTVLASAGLSGDSLDAGGGTGDRLIKANDVAQVDLSDTLLDETGFDDDSLAGFESASLTGGPGDNDMDASGFSTGNVTLAALGGADTLRGTPTAGDSLDAGADSDLLDANDDVDFTLSDSQLAAGADVDAIANFDEASLQGGGSGNDFDASAFSGPVTMFGFNGDDSFVGGAASDVISGGADTNVLAQTADADQTLVDTLLSGVGDDSISLIDSVTLAGGASGNEIDASGFNQGTVSIDGAGGADSLVGTADTDTIAGGSEDDTLEGGFEDDSLAGGSGAADRLLQSGADQTLTDASADGQGEDSIGGIEQASLSGSPSADLISAEVFSGRVTIDGSGSGDTVIGAAGADSLDGNAGTDRLVQSADSDQTLTDSSLSGDGADSIGGFERASLIGGGSANEIDASGFLAGFGVTLDGAGGTDTIEGSPLGDTLAGGAGTGDLIRQTGGPNQVLSDTMLSGTGGDGISGFEAASLTGTGDPNIITATSFTGGPVTLSGLNGADSLNGSAQGDSLDGGALGDVISADAGADTVVGGTGSDSGAGAAGADLLDGGDEADSLEGEQGADTLIGADGADDLFGGLDADSLDGGDDADDLDGGPGANTLTGALGEDTITGGADADLLVESADSAETTLTDNLFETGVEDNTLTSIESASLTGGAAANTIDASPFTLGPVSLAGGAGDDSLTGSAQGDVLTGGADEDLLDGAAGDDTHNTADGFADTNLCGPGNDTANVDSLDTNTACETTTDLTPPETTITSGPANGATITTSSATFGFTSNEAGSSFTCKLDGGATEACDSGSKTYSGLSEGSHAFSVFATDAAGNPDGSPATRTFTVDLPDPPPPPPDPDPPAPDPDPDPPAPDPGPDPDPGADTTAPQLRISGRKKQKSANKIVVKATCADEACELVGSGKVKVKKGKKTKKVKLKRVKASGEPGEKVKLALKLKGKKDKKLLKKAIKKGKTSKAQIKVKATDAAGNAVSEKRTVKVKGNK